MEATELIGELDKLIMKHGDCDIYYEYDEGMRVACKDVTFQQNFTGNTYSDQWSNIKEGFIINHDKE